MAERFDISDKSIHFTGGRECSDDTYARSRAILRDGRLIAGNGMIRGDYRCVRFTEAALAAFASAFVSRFPFTRYSRFGSMFDKSWIFARGGRPVIYQPESDFDLPPEAFRRRHVRFEPIGKQIVDFTWEREWRIPRDQLTFGPAEAVIIVPSDKWVDALEREHAAGQNTGIERYAQMIEREIAEMWRGAFPWRVMTLE